MRVTYNLSSFFVTFIHHPYSSPLIVTLIRHFFLGRPPSSAAVGRCWRWRCEGGSAGAGVFAAAGS
jgi:hypothetical protein